MHIKSDEKNYISLTLNQLKKPEMAYIEQSLPLLRVERKQINSPGRDSTIKISRPNTREIGTMGKTQSSFS